MARARVQAKDLPEDAEIILVDPDQESEAEAEEAANLSNLMADLGELDNIKITVYRCKEGSKVSWVDSFAPSELDIEQLLMGLRTDYGGGKFKIQVRESGRIMKSKIVEVEPLPKKKELDSGEIIRELKREQETESHGMTSILAEMIKANQEAQRQQSEQMTTFMSNMITAMAGMNQNSQPAIDPIAMQSSILQSVQTLRDMTKPPPAVDPTALILKGVELVNAVKGDASDGEANIYSVLSSALNSFGGTLGQALNIATPPTPETMKLPQETEPNPSAASDASTRLPAPTPASNASIQGAHAERLPADHPLATFEPYVDYMLTLARKNANPELYAEVIIDQIGEEMAKAWLGTSEGLQTLSEHLPRTKEYMPWFVLVGQAVDEFITEGENPPDVLPPPNSPEATTQPISIDGDSKRSGGNQSNLTIDGEVSEPSKNDG